MLVLALAMGAAFGFGGEARADLTAACAEQKTTAADAGPCSIHLASFPPNQAKFMACQQACNQATQDCNAAKSQCQSAGAQDKVLQQSGAAENQSAADAAAAAQQGKELGNAANMCSGQSTQQARSALGKPIPGVLAKCSSSAQNCQSQQGNGSQAKSDADKASAAVTKENAARAGEAAQMAAKCGQSAQNAQKLGEMPKMPEMPQMGGAGAGPNSSLTPDTAVNAKDPGKSLLESGTSKTGAVAFGDPVSLAPTAGLPGDAGSGISGSTALGSGSSVSSNNTEKSNTAMAGGSFKGAGPSSSSGSSGQSGAMNNSGAAAKPSAAGEGGAKSESNAYEMNLGGTKPMLGLKPKGDEEDPLAAFAAGDAAKGMAAGKMAENLTDGAARRGLAAANGTAAATRAEDGSLFKMVKGCYNRLRGIGQI